MAKNPVDKNRLKKLAEAGGNMNDICKELGTTKLAVKTALTDLMLSEGRVYQITGWESKTPGYKPPKVATVGKKGAIYVPKALIEDMSPAEGEQFNVACDTKKNQIVLTPVSK